ncbi:hypothetical protein MEO43_20815, partial [Dolichospermum sp. ST_sed5]|nr:hypothetical protein [Dolichospermum sp. ST_sed5]
MTIFNKDFRGILITPGDWKSRLHRRNPPSWVIIFNLLLVREGGLRLYGSAISNRQGYLFVRLVTVFNKLSRKEGTGIK